MQHFYQTTTLSPTELKESEHKALTQDLISLRKIDRNTPLTSIRARISTLTKNGLLSETGRQERGYFGKPEGIWALPVTQSITTQTTLFQ